MPTLPSAPTRATAARISVLVLACAASLPMRDMLHTSLTTHWAQPGEPIAFEAIPERDVQIGRAANVLVDVWNVPPPTAESIVRASVAEGERHGLPASLLLGMMAAESGFRTQVRNGYGAVGLMQVVASIHSDKLPPGSGHHALTRPDVNIAVGARILSDCLRSADGNLTRALARYSGNARNYATKVRRHARAFELALGDIDTPLSPGRNPTSVASG